MRAPEPKRPTGARAKGQPWEGKGVPAGGLGACPSGERAQESPRQG